MRMHGPAKAGLSVLCAVLLLTTGCARFNDAAQAPYTTEPEMHPPSTTTPPPPPPLPANPYPKECPAPGVMQGCLESTSGLIMLPGGGALVAERTTGVVKHVAVDAEPVVEFATPVDASGDGGLMDIVRSPTYNQDRLTYAYISTPTDNRVVRIADGEGAKPILTGIPKGATGNMGALTFTSPTTLTVLTGDAGNPALAADPKSLAGKVLRIEQPTTVNQAPVTTALSGIGAGGGLCVDILDDNTLYVTDRTATGDRLQRITHDGKASTVWTWPDRPGIAGCAVLGGIVMVNLVNTKQTVRVKVEPASGTVTGEPEVVRQDTHGHAWALAVAGDGNIWGATVNKTSGDAMQLDDVVFPLFPKGGGFPRPPDDLL